MTWLASTYKDIRTGNNSKKHHNSNSNSSRNRPTLK